VTQASTPTLLSLDRYAKIMGINPVHFSQAVGSGDIFPITKACSDVWWQRAYIRSDHISREDIAQEIATAEEDIARYIGYYPAPKFISREMHMFPRDHRPDMYDGGRNVRLDAKSLKTKFGRLIGGGRRWTSLIANASTGGGTMVWSDPDGDGFDERMTITVATTLTNASRQQIKVYQWGEDAEEFEIRDPRSVEIAAGVLTIEFDFWKMIDPALQDIYPIASPQALDIVDPAIYIIRCDVRREYLDYSQHSVEFFWEPRCDSLSCATCGGSGCSACQSTVQCGCFHVRNVDLGIGVPSPASWDADSGAWAGAEFTLCYAPDSVKIWYYAGDMSERFLSGRSLDPLSDWWAQTIAYLATARMERNFCSCGNVTALAADLRQEWARADRDGPTFFPDERDKFNPFGTRKGEILAWRRVSQLAPKVPKVAVV